MDEKRITSGNRQSFRDAGGQGAIVFDPVRLRQAACSLFDPQSYGVDAQPVRGAGGRGAAWFVRGPFGDAVLRQYRRGGWMARLSADAYLWQGEPRVRSFAEFELLLALRAAGLPVPAPVAACYRRQGWRYRAAILVDRIIGASSFAEAVRTAGANAPWSQVGMAIGRCHRHRAHHADLNANNILMTAGEVVHLIDWDKGRIEASAGAWQQRALDRLARSLRKECPDLPSGELERGMQRLRGAHDQELAA